ncbi:MAG TPA: histidinol dehydrogenase, partial [Candidatus Limnocylindrales bacterium]|nr:histidinol dehydrogenase [Candidatus Limnocylindrales bacterium]
MTAVDERDGAAREETIVLRRVDLADPASTPEVRRLVRRGAVPDAGVQSGAAAIIEDVRRRGTEAVREANERFGGGLSDGRLVVGREELDAAAARLDPAVRRALEAAASNIERFAAASRPTSGRVRTATGVEIERRWTPVDRAGCYVPGGSAPYPSSLLMTVVPARVAGVTDIMVASPARPDGSLDPVVAGAAGLVGVDGLLVAGGAQAVAALAFGLPEETLEAVDVIVGPGNAWVTAAKLAVSGSVAIDLPAGPSEGLVLADGAADPRIVAADLLTQAEHGTDSPAILVTTSPALADAVEAEIDERLGRQPRREILLRSLAEHGRIILAPSLDAAVAFVNAYAPEHLSIDVEPLEATVAAVRRAGSIFVGRWAPESAGDYATGANHVLPTGGLARGRGPLSVETFGTWSQVQRVDRAGLATLRATIGTLAAAEGLEAHRRAVEERFELEPPDVELAFADIGPATRAARVNRRTRETDVTVDLRLDGTGAANVRTGIGFLDHLLTSLAHHALFDLEVRATGDLEVDEHHTTEDVALVLGSGLAEALGDRAGIVRFGDASVPLDEALATVAVDVGGRPYAVIDLPFRGERVGDLPLQLVEHWL